MKRAIFLVVPDKPGYQPTRVWGKRAAQTLQEDVRALLGLETTIRRISGGVPSRKVRRYLRRWHGQKYANATRRANTRREEPWLAS
jgi:hypothetical protein